MAMSTIFAVMSGDGGKSVHPFFNKASTKTATEQPRNENQSQEDLEYEPVEQRGESDEKPKRTRSKRKQKDEKSKNQPTLADIVNPKPAFSQVETPAGQVVSELSTEQDEPRKRRRTGGFESADVESDNAAASVTPAIGTHSPRVIIPRSSPLPRIHPLDADLAENYTSQTVAKTPPKKLLQLNANGRFSSPPANSPEELSRPPSQPQIDETPNRENDTSLTKKIPARKVLRLNANGRFSSPPSKNPKENTEPTSQLSTGRLRPRKAAAAATSRLVSIAYGADEAGKISVGEKIDKILAGTLTVAIVKKPPPKKRTPQKPRKPTHPFFSGKPDQVLSAPKPESPRKTSAVTPGKLRVKAFSERLPDVKDVEFSSALLRDRHMVKHPGATEAPFPDRDQVHVRGDVHQIKLPMRGPTFELLFPRRKFKQVVLPLSKRESVTARFESRLTAPKDPHLRPDGFHDPDVALTLPERHLMTGEDIAQRICGELSVPIAETARDELSYSADRSSKSSPCSRRGSHNIRKIHPSLPRLYERIPSALTAFDQCRGESQSWAQKYAPRSSSDVLQPDTEVSVLKGWLQSLAVQAVGGAATDSKSIQPRVAEKPKKKRKKRSDDMDDFLVDSDEDLREMNEIPAAEQGVDSGMLKTKGSIVQSVSNDLKLSNTVLLSGPHGCGKTAAAYAVAEELGFKVFEIGSNERRSGRDVLEKVGDMTENHMVRHHGVESAESQPPAPTLNDEAFQRDLESGRQGKMNAFFKPQPAQRASVEPKKLIKEKKIKAIQEAIKKPAKDQQQSLILLEEVDILFKDDKDFWMTVMKLITTSKRPFIMTCNDETAVPLQAIALHAILRFKEPPPDLATDYMLLLAAAEGHLLKRAAVLSLYQHHRHDLRASITELDYWCQMGVGDPRGGLAWIYQRYPPGSDLDDQGRKLRVVSANTYQSGMGIPSEAELDAQGAMAWAWNEFNVSPSAALGWVAMSADVQDSNPQDRLKTLNSFLDHADALSAADVCTAASVAATAPFDPSQPELMDKARSNYTVAQDLLQINEITDYMGLGRDVLIAMTLSAHQRYNGSLASTTIVTNALETSLQAKEGDEWFTRQSFACFDPIATSSELSLNNNPGLMQSVFDGTMKTITLDLAPYVRSIVQYDKALEEQRARLSLLNSEGRSSKRQRTTRAARSALEGGQRASTRRERWFAKELDLEAVLATGGEDWPRFSYSPPSVDTASKDGTESTTPASSAGIA
uniref:AAA+ ATPase domain-containing protein n=1 Tax=Ramularia collo-cygni TaxID=112498 RepID=A0A2D3UQC1_9PEZI